MGERRYDDREVGLILKRVAELHEREGADARAMTRAEIEQVVAELGISRQLVTRAVSEISVRDIRNRPAWLVGGKTDVMFETSVDGEVDEARLTRMLEVLRRFLGSPGKLEREGAARIWSTQETRRQIYFTVVEHEDHTTLRLEERMPGDAGATVVLATAGGGFTGFMAMVPLKVILIKSMLLLAMGPLVVLGALLGWLLGRSIWKRLAGTREKELRAAFGEILALAPSGPEPDQTATDRPRE